MHTTFHDSSTVASQSGLAQRTGTGQSSWLKRRGTGQGLTPGLDEKTGWHQDWMRRRADTRAGWEDGVTPGLARAGWENGLTPGLDERTGWHQGWMRGRGDTRAWRPLEACPYYNSSMLMSTWYITSKNPFQVFYFLNTHGHCAKTLE